MIESFSCSYNELCDNLQEFYKGFENQKFLIIRYNENNLIFHGIYDTDTADDIISLAETVYRIGYSQGRNEK